MSAVLATGTALVILGVAGGIATALDGKVWLANVITGTATLLALGSLTAIRAQVRRNGRLRRLKQRYEHHETMRGAAAKGGGASEDRC